MEDLNFMEMNSQEQEHKLRVLKQTRRWSWGAFGFHWIWGVCNGVLWPLTVTVIVALLTMLTTYLSVRRGELTTLFWTIVWLGALTDMAISVVLGLYGRRQSWGSKWRSWSSLESFVRTQRIWDVAFFIALAVAVIGSIAWLLFFVLRLLANSNLV